MFNRIFCLCFFMLLFSNNSIGETKYPSDSSLTDKNIPAYRKVFILPISVWQRLSYNLSFLNCQYTPSCSNFAVESISKHGLLLGTVMTTDRIIRCNPFALYYYSKENNLTEKDITPYYGHKCIPDPVPLENVVLINNNHIESTCLSMIIPGAGRIYQGRFWDGLFSFITFSLCSYNAYQSYRNDQYVKFGVFSIISIAFYGGEIYGVNSYNNELHIKKP